jgi:hypothetical protein
METPGQVRHSWAGGGGALTPYGGADLGSFVQGGWTEQEAQKTARELRRRVGAPLKHAIEDALFYAECR